MQPSGYCFYLAQIIVYLFLFRSWNEPGKLPVTFATITIKIIMDELIESGEGILHHAEGVDLMPLTLTLPPHSAGTKKW